MNPKHTLLIPLVGPMQSWGYRSRFDDRDTNLEPTRSGVIGLLCSARGIPRSDTLSLELLDTAVRIGIRIDASGKIMTDYHTAQNVQRAGEGLQETVVSNRHYIADARFLVGLESANLTLLNQLANALHNPVWTLSLGRKSFPLAVPPYLPSGSLIENTALFDALSNTPWIRLTSREKKPELLRYMIEEEPGVGATVSNDAIVMTLGDRPLNFEKRRFGLRRVIVSDYPSALIGKEDLCISPN